MVMLTPNGHNDIEQAKMVRNGKKGADQPGESGVPWRVQSKQDSVNSRECAGVQ